ncbi:NAD(P)H-dependent oxidoreductase [Actinophytocola sp.]|uniref:NADPH-dependent FMN reductase n=1 Tax=Actinophytocola sp. TaxID=1872138 RepID=UPI002D7E7581|nr:NAD(P)H-dependent oxidoreductase [Actinophytocola sp.]HET9143629.1 NAD(P)H-dependent oxidoreductase [Actinophytocola sp.]
MGCTAPLLVAVIIGSTREGRVGEAVGRWFSGLAGSRAGLTVDVVDLAGFDLPARYPNTATAQVRAFTERIGRADAFVVVTPEYNRSFPASLKQAIDLGYDEWQGKAVGFVSYGCGSDGVYAVEQLRSVFTELHAATVRNRVGFDLMDGGFDAGGTPADPDRADRAASTLLDQLTWWGHALRNARPYLS